MTGWEYIDWSEFLASDLAARLTMCVLVALFWTFLFGWAGFWND